MDEKILIAREAYIQALWDIFYDRLTDEIWKSAPEGKQQQEVDLFSEYFQGHAHPPTDGWADTLNSWATMGEDELQDDMILHAEDACDSWYEEWKENYLETLTEKEFDD